MVQPPLLAQLVDRGHEAELLEDPADIGREAVDHVLEVVAQVVGRFEQALRS